MKPRIINIVAYLMLSATIIFNLWLYYPETKILADPNDNAFQFSLVNRTDWVWQNYNCPLSFSCLPNLIDHMVPNWAEGYPLPFYYTHVPQIVTVASYNLLIKPIAGLFNSPLTIYQYYNWTKYLLLSFLPLTIFLALRVAGFTPIMSVLAAFFAFNFSTDGLYGIDAPSFLWRGWGLTSQLYAIFFLPLGIAFIYRALQNITSFAPLKSAGGARGRAPDSTQSTIGDEYWREGELATGPASYKEWVKVENISKIKDILWAIIFLTFTTMGHLGVGIIGILSTLPFVFMDLNINNIIRRIQKLFYILFPVFFILAYWIVPILLNNQYHMISFWDPIWKFDSYGWYEVVRQFFQGEIFDWKRFPLTTILVSIGFIKLLLHPKKFSFPLLFLFWLLLYFGRTTWGGMIDLIPGMKDFHLHRFIVGIHIAALFLLPSGLEYVFSLIKIIASKIAGYLAPILIRIKIESGNNTSFALSDSKRVTGARYPVDVTFDPAQQKGGEGQALREKDLINNAKVLNKKTLVNINLLINIIYYITIFSFISFLAFYTLKQTIDFASFNSRWIGEANTAYLYDEKNYLDLKNYLNTLPPARIYAGRPGNWGKDFRLGSSQMYMLLGTEGYNMSQFLPETWAPLSENEQNFDERVADDYDLLNIKYIVAPKNQNFTQKATLDKKFGPFELYKVPTSGWFDVVESPMFVSSDKTNFLNIVHLWQTSFARRWKMYPFISVEKNPQIPAGMKRNLKMIDEVTYKEDNLKHNIFKDFPLVFPQATVSGTINNEKVEKQTYKAKVELPANCNSCTILLKINYHPDWKATLDGKSVETFAVFPFYLAVQATPGIHDVEFSYQPNSLKMGILIIEIMSAILIPYLFNKYYKKRNR